MKKPSILFWLLIFSVMFSACQSQQQPLTTSSSTPRPLVTLTLTPTRILPTDTPSPTLAPKPTMTPFPPYPLKQVLLSYTVSSYPSPFAVFFSDFKYPIIVVYTDGQLIIAGQPYRQKVLSKDEINRLLKKLEIRGFYTIESNQQHDPSDRLYDFGDQYEKTYDGLFYCVLINAARYRELCVDGPYLRFIIPEMNDILTYLDDYEPAGMTVYYPDRILLSVQEGIDPSDPTLPKEAILWTEPSLSLEAASQSENMLYAEGELAKELYQFYGGIGHLFTYKDKEYTVYIHAVLPHEEIKYIYGQ